MVGVASMLFSPSDKGEGTRSLGDIRMNNKEKVAKFAKSQSRAKIVLMFE